MKKNWKLLVFCLIIMFFINCNIAIADSSCDKYATHNEEICNYESSTSGEAVCRCLYDLNKTNETTCDRGYTNNVLNICEASFPTTYDFSKTPVENNPSNTNNTESDDTIKGSSDSAGNPTIGDSGPRLEYNNLCESEGFKTGSKIAGIVILVAKWLTPLALMILGMIDFFKAVISSNEKALSDATTTFIKRIVIAIIVPFVPGLLFYLVDFFIGDEIADTKVEFGSCTECLKDPLNCTIK